MQRQLIEALPGNGMEESSGSIKWVKPTPSVVDPRYFPELLLRHPELRLPAYIATVVFENQPLPFPTEGLTIKQLIMHLGDKMFCPSRRFIALGEIVFDNWHRERRASHSQSVYLASLLGKSPDVAESDMPDSEQEPAYLKDLLGEQQLPYFEVARHEPHTKGTIIDYLAVALVQGRLLDETTGRPFTNITTLMQPNKERNLPVSVNSLPLVIQRLPTIGSIQKLVASGYVPKDGVDSFLQSVAVWNLRVSLEEERSAIFNSLFFPFPQELKAEGRDSYDVRYLPYLVAAMSKYLVELPNFLRPGKMVDPKTIIEKVEALAVLCRSTIDGQLDGDAKAVMEARVREGLHVLKNTLINFVESGAWNRRKGIPPAQVRYGANGGTTPSTSDIHSNILSHGGRDPSRLAFQRGNEIRKGQI